MPGRSTKLKLHRQGLSTRRGLYTAFPLQVYTGSGKGSMSARSFNPETEDEETSEHEEANEGEVPVRTESESEEERMCNNHRQRGNVPQQSSVWGRSDLNEFESSLDHLQ